MRLDGAWIAVNLNEESNVDSKIFVADATRRAGMENPPCSLADGVLNSLKNKSGRSEQRPAVVLGGFLAALLLSSASLGDTVARESVGATELLEA